MKTLTEKLALQQELLQQAEKLGNEIEAERLELKEQENTLKSQAKDFLNQSQYPEAIKIIQKIIELNSDIVPSNERYNTEPEATSEEKTKLEPKPELKTELTSEPKLKPAPEAVKSEPTPEPTSKPEPKPEPELKPAPEVIEESESDLKSEDSTKPAHSEFSHLSIKLESGIPEDNLSKLRIEIKNVLLIMNQPSEISNVQEILIDPMKIENLISKATTLAKMQEDELGSEDSHDFYRNLTKTFHTLTAKQKYSLHTLPGLTTNESSTDTPIKPELVESIPSTPASVTDYRTLIQQDPKSFYKIVEVNQEIEDWEECIINELRELPSYSHTDLETFKTAVSEELSDLKYKEIIEFNDLEPGYKISEENLKILQD
jgi:outer membrane biosynthesis protein TonB